MRDCMATAQDGFGNFRIGCRPYMRDCMATAQNGFGNFRIGCRMFLVYQIFSESHLEFFRIVSALPF